MSTKGLQTLHSIRTPEKSARESGLWLYARGYLGAIGCVAASAIFRMSLTGYIGTGQAWVFFFPAIAFVAWTWGLGPGCISVAASAMAAIWFFVPPEHSFVIRDPSGWVMVWAFSLSGLLMVVFGASHAGSLRRLEQESLDREQAQADLAQSLEIFRGVFDNARGDAMILMSPEQRIEAWNAGAEALFGWTAAEAVGESIGILGADLIVGSEAGDTVFVRADRGESAYAERVFKTREGGEVWGQAVTTALHHPFGGMGGYLTIVRDGTARRQYEQMIVTQNETLEKIVEGRTAELLAANAELEGFTYSVSHDMRAPLRGIVGNSRMLIEDYAQVLDSDGQIRLARLAASALKLNSLVEDLLTYARLGKQSPSGENCNLSDLFMEVVSDEICDETAEIECEQDVYAYCDPGLIRMVLGNLVSNAVKYRRPSASLHIVFGVECQAGHEAYFVRDSGIGFQMEYKEKLFKPFERLHRDDQYPGTGIGLANVMRIVERHGGKVWAEGRPGEGSTFWFTLNGPDQTGLSPSERPTVQSRG